MSTETSQTRKSSVDTDNDDIDTSGPLDAATDDVNHVMASVRAALDSGTTGMEVNLDENEEVKISEHMDMNGLTINEQESATNTSGENSVQPSPVMKPAMASTADSSSSSAVPAVELQDGGNAVQTASTSSSVAATSSSSSSATEESNGVKKDFFDVRIAIVGNVDSGKSTLIGVLTGGSLDDGRGKARSRVFIHAHELGTGRTSAISQHVMGFDANGKPVHQTVAASAQSAVKSKSWNHVISESKSIVTFIDLAGHEKYLKTTIAGLTGSHPDYACVIVNSLAGVTKMTREHLGVVLALEIPLICVVTKVDLAPTTVLEASKKQLFKILKSSAANKIPIQMRSEKDIETVISNSETSNKICPVFFISAVNGTHIPLLTTYLSKLRPHLDWLQQYANNMPITRGPDGTTHSHPNACEFSIDEVFNVSGVGIVVSGTLNSGTLHTNTTLLLGPYSDNSFIQVLVRSLHYKRVACSQVEAGQSCAISIRAVKRKETLKRNLIRRGMVLVDPIVQPQSTRIFDAEVLILHHPTTIKLGYQAVLHLYSIRQTAQIVRIGSTIEQNQCLRTGSKAICRFRFLQREEYLHTGTPFVFREGSTKGIGRITRVQFTDEEKHELDEEERMRRRQGGKSQLHPKKGEEEFVEDSDTTLASTSTSASGSSNTAAAAASSAKPSTTSHSHPTSSSTSNGSKHKWNAKEKHEYHQKNNEKHK